MCLVWLCLIGSLTLAMMESPEMVVSSTRVTTECPRALLNVVMTLYEPPDSKMCIQQLDSSLQPPVNR